jgi:exopolyphosphatase/guanosine-5'-triphosphate,3'-diphosphate pyrophosphatase
VNLSVAQTELRSSDVALVHGQLGREPTTTFSVVARCTGGHPLVIRNSPLDAAGDPFPTTYWLTCPDAVRAVSRLESEGWIAKLNERAAGDVFAQQLSAAHRAYAEERAELHEPARAWGGVGGTRRGIKCLHAHYAYRIAGGEDPVGAWVAERIEPFHPQQPSGRVAAIDQGTNSSRLLVLEPGDPPTELARDMVITRLGRGVDGSGAFEPGAVERTMLVLSRYVRRARALGAERIRMGATSAVRDAANRAEFLGAVRTLIGMEPEVIDGEREARLSFLGATVGIDASLGPFLLLDVGGGSCEFVLGRGPGRADRAISTQMGSVRMTERCVRSDPPSAKDLRCLEREIDSILVEVESAIPRGEARTFLSVAGTPTTVQAIARGLSRYDPEVIHRSWLSAEQVDRVLVELAGMTDEERAALPVMVPGRGDVIVAGAAILSCSMRRLGFDRVLVSEADILDGLAYELLGIS